MTEHDEAVSSIVSAVLVFGLIVSVSLVWTVTTLPQWVADREHQHQLDVQEGFGNLQAGLDALSASGDDGPVTLQVALGARSIPLLQTTPSSGTLSFEDGLDVTGAFSNVRLHAVDLTGQGPPDAEASGGSLADVASLRSLRLGLVTSGVDAAGEAGAVVALASDGTNTVTVALTHAFQGTSCSASEVRLTVTQAFPTAGTPVTRPLLCNVGTALGSAGNPYTMDLLERSLGVAGALERLDPGFSVTFSETGLGQGTYSAWWADSDGLDRVAGSGLASTYSLAQESGRLSYVPFYRQGIEQELSWESGAVLARQSDGQAVTRAAPFTLERATGSSTAHLSITLTELHGEGSRSGSDSATVHVRHRATSDVLLQCSSATLTWTGGSADGWQEFMADSILVGGATGAATSSATSTAATLTLGGGGVTTWIVHLRLVTADVDVL